jgi:hypothetical protein
VRPSLTVGSAAQLWLAQSNATMKINERIEGVALAMRERK